MKFAATTKPTAKGKKTKITVTVDGTVIDQRETARTYSHAVIARYNLAAVADGYASRAKHAARRDYPYLSGQDGFNGYNWQNAEQRAETMKEHRATAVEFVAKFPTLAAYESHQLAEAAERAAKYPAGFVSIGYSGRDDLAQKLASQTASRGDIAEVVVVPVVAG